MGGRDSRSANNNIVIVCEGSDTEPSYLKEVKAYVEQNYPGRFSDIKIVPIGSEAAESAKRNAANKRKKRNLRRPVDDSVAGYYWVMPEYDPELFERYRVQPARYVREAQLFLENGYTEAWAVYDRDKFDGHKTAMTLADTTENLHISISCISFEEWLLLHFERNDRAFVKSSCKNSDNKDLGCGTQHAGVGDCHGMSCIAGYLRENSLIPNFAKSNSDLFVKYTLPRLEIARINAAWVRGLDSTTPIYERNPYTDFDYLLSRLLGIDKEYVWMGELGKCSINRTDLIISEANGVITVSTAARTFIAQCFFADNLGKRISLHRRLQIEAGTETSLSITDKSEYFIIEDSLKLYVFTLK